MSSSPRRPDQPAESEAGKPPRFEESLAELEKIARDLEDGELGLEDALLRYEMGVKLLRQCHDLLGKAERRIELLAGVDADGNPVLRSFEIPENGVSEATSAAPATKAKPPAEGGEPRSKTPTRRAEDRAAPRPRRPSPSGEIDESRELF